LDDTALSLNQAACDGCELCVPACPPGAITRQQDLQLTLNLSPHQPVVLLACELALTAQPAERIPCIHAIGLTDLLQLLQQGIHELVITTAACDQCYRRTAPRLETRLAPLNRSLARSGHTGIRLQYCSASQWEQRKAQVNTVPETPLSRRGFLRKLSQSGLQQGLQLAGLEENTATGSLAPGHMFLASNGRTEWPFVPHIDAQRCVGCDACAKLCPQQAIRMSHEPCAYCIDAKQCNGCNICVDVCDQQAVSLEYWQPQRQSVIALQTQSCRACGIDFHLPAERELPAQTYCQICAQHNHHRNLFQILE
jgi:ferredoxin